MCEEKKINKKEQRKIEIPESVPEYSNAAILAYNRGIEEYNSSNYDKSIYFFNLAAKQEREKGFCECIIVDEQKSVLEKTVARLCELFPEDSIVQQSALMLKLWNL